MAAIITLESNENVKHDKKKYLDPVNSNNMAIMRWDDAV